MPPLTLAVLDDYQRVASSLADWASLGSDVSVEFFHDHLVDRDALVTRLERFDAIAIMRERTPFPRELVERLPRLRLLVTTAMRNASIDVQACSEHGITVCGTGAGAGAGTTELTWTLILALVRGLTQEDRALRGGTWQTLLGTQVRGKTLGIVGLGKIGEGVARIGSAFGMNVIAWSQNLTPERANACEATQVEKDDLFARADVVTIHLVLSDRTRGIVGRAEIAKMKPTAYLVNTSRGPIVDADALVDALRAGRFAGAGLDVYEREPLDRNDPLLSAPNTILTPHVGYVTRETYEVFYCGIVEAVRAWRSGSPIRVIAPSR